MVDRRGALGLFGGSLALSALPATGLAADSAPATSTGDIDVVPIRFDNESATLAGAIYSPRTAPVGALVIVHGSGREPRMDWLARIFAANGFAVVSYDKRGVAESGGTYEEKNNVSPENLRLLAGDAAAAMRALRQNPAFAGLKRGYWGISQAGWIVPIANSRFEPADFMVLWSGPLCTVCEEIESGIGHGGNISDDASARRAVDEMRAQGRDTDPRDTLRGVSTHGLWIYGGRDETQPTKLSIERLQGLIDGGKGNFAYWLNSAAHHADFEASRPFFDGMKRWMLEQVGAAPQG
jgi:hypothetical protein